MQLGGIGNNHNSDMHQVTQCMHDHTQSKLDGGKMLTTPGTATQQTLKVHQEQTAQLSIGDMLQKMFRSIGQRLLNFWNGGDTTASDQTGDKADTSQLMAQVYEKNDTGVANSVKQEHTLQNNPYFTAMAEPNTIKPSLGQRIKLKCKGVASQLADHLPGRFKSFTFNKRGSFQAKKEGNKEDLRKRSRYREDTLEIDCMLTDESYLLDSYDRKGEYRQLTTDK